jgi:multidrug efflux pump subunit AcrA (membrane-fusion protein)
VNARLLQQEKTGVTLLPSAAIQRNTNDTYVYLIKPDNTVTVRNHQGRDHGRRSVGDHSGLETRRQGRDDRRRQAAGRQQSRATMNPGDAPKTEKSGPGKSK